MDITPDQVVIADLGVIQLNATVVVTWLLMAGLVLLSWLITRRLDDSPEISRRQNFMEALLETVLGQIDEVTQDDPRRYLPLVGTLFIFIAISNLLTIVPGYLPPTGSIYTTAAMAGIVFLAVPAYGIASQGVLGYLKSYLAPNPFMLPFNILGELSRTLALAVRLFGNVMSGTMLVGILMAIAPLFFPVLMQILGLLTGLIQAYIFAVLALVYITAGTEVQSSGNPPAGTGSTSATSSSDIDTQGVVHG